MTSNEKIPAPLDAKRLRELIIDALTHEKVVLRFHARFDHWERRISVDDVLFGLRTKWKSCRPSRFNKEEWQWTYEIVTSDSDDRELTVIAAVDTRNKRVDVVTRYQ
jgi:hypothetical protein